MNKSISIACVSIIIMLAAGAAAFADITPWADIWTNAGYHSTNGERNNFNSYLLRSEGKFGVQLNAAGPNMAIEPYLAYYGVISQDPHYWNNNVALGAGVRMLPFFSYESSSWANEWLKDVKLFVETVNLTILNDQVSADHDQLKYTDSRWGLDLWHEWNLNKDIDTGMPWDEMWLNLSYRQTDFMALANNFPGDQFNTYLLYLQNKFGMHLSGGIRPYLVTYLTTAGVSKSWLNSLYYGVGLRMEPFRDQKDPPEILRKFKMFVEVLNIAWLKENEGRPGTDLYFGVDLTFGR
ncbi:MAG TPA: hypothetical protein VMD02_06190 [Candidatus Omnitrophota bacterium]|nr:hypothetical protein [Candidatus Omnitrophota bacterium]